MSATRVLIIDDSLTIRAILEALLEREGFRIVGLADSIAQARALVAQHRPDVVTLDLAMPGEDGMSYLAELSGRAHPPVVVLSSSTPDKSDGARAAIAAGAAACFDKANLVPGGARFARLLRRQAERARDRAA